MEMIEKAEKYLARPASASERAPLFGEDANLILENTLSSLTEHNDADSLAVRALALALLRRPAEAQAALAMIGEGGGEGGGEATSASCGALAARARAIVDKELAHQAQVREKRNLGLLEILECPVCCELLLEPLTLNCGHSLCRHCCVRALDATQRCPMCRALTYTDSRTAPVSTVLLALIKSLFEKEYEARAQTVRAQEQALSNSSVRLGIFSMQHVLPHLLLPLNIFEPRYRLLFRRAISGSKKLILAGYNDGVPATVGCVAVVENSQVQADGRISIMLRVTHRVRLSDFEEIDGYRTALATEFHDEPETLAESANAAGDSSEASAESATESAAEGGEGKTISEIISVLDPVATHLHSQMLHASDEPVTAPERPNPAVDLEAWSFWAASSFLYVRMPQPEVANLLTMTSSSQRIRRTFLQVSAMKRSCTIS